MRLQKYLAEAGLGSRRGCEDLIRAGRVTIDGIPVELGVSVDPRTQAVAVDGRPVTQEKKEYWLLNKPVGVLSAAVDARGRRTVVDCVPSHVRVFPVGRLDLSSSGVLLLTNDGELAARLLHPRYHVEKEYVVTVRGIVAEAALGLLRRGVLLEDGKTAPASVEVLSHSRPGRAGMGAGSGTSTTLRITLHEGRKRQIRRMLEAVGHRVVSLHRRRFAGLTDAGLNPGEARELLPAELEALRRAAFGG
ncbi:MAG: rRNA pseudouridine synthase [Thermoleophilia bacterium]|nr:rRNA pseudouridine synthase [Thermoleophilia bacterium]